MHCYKKGKENENVAKHQKENDNKCTQLPKEISKFFWYGNFQEKALSCLLFCEALLLALFMMQKQFLMYF